MIRGCVGSIAIAAHAAADVARPDRHPVVLAADGGRARPVPPPISAWPGRVTRAPTVGRKNCASPPSARPSARRREASGSSDVGVGSGSGSRRRLGFVGRVPARRRPCAQAGRSRR